MKRTVLIVGGGISGLSTAWQLGQRSNQPFDIRVLEGSPRPGGTAWTEREAGYLLETGPNGFLDNKPAAIGLCRAVGLEEHLLPASDSAADRFVYLGDRLRRLPRSPGQFLRSDLLSWSGRLRVLAERFVPRREQAGEESIHDFGCRRLGREAAEKLLDAFVTGILAGDPKLLSLQACFPRIAELEAKYGSLIRAQGALARERRSQGVQTKGSTGGPGGTLTTLRGGMRTLIDRLAELLGASLLLHSPAQTLERTSDGGWTVTISTGSLSADAVVLACPAAEQGRLLRGVRPGLAEELSAIPYAGAIVAVVGYRKADVPPLKGFGYLSPQRLGRPVLGVIWTSSVFPEQTPDDRVQLRAILGGWNRADVLDWADTQIEGELHRELAETLGITANPEFFWTCRWRRAIPQYHVGHLVRLERIDRGYKELPGLFLTGNCLRGVSLNDCISNGERIASEVAAYLEGLNAAKGII